MEFREIFEAVLNERIEADGNYNGLSVFGELVNVFIEKEANNNLMGFRVSGSSLLPKIKSVEATKDEYDEKDWLEIEKQYTEIMKKASSEIAQALSVFEKSLKTTIKKLEKTTNKF